VHLAMKQVRDATSRVLDGTSLADLRSQMAAAGPSHAVAL
jgi:DNA-binding IscR family transcriptional regulator